MKRLVLKKEILEKVRDDETLKGYVATALRIKSPTLYTWLRYNNPKLTQKSALIVISEHLRIKENDLLEIQKDSGKGNRTAKLTSVNT